MSKIRVAVADDHIYAVEGLQKIVSEAEDMECVGSASEILELPKLVKETFPDVLVLDIAWLGDKQAGIGILPDIRQIHPKIQVVAITVYPELIEPARQAGAFPLNKGFSRHELYSAIRWAARQTGTAKTIPSQAGILPLTPAEQGVLDLLVKGLPDKQIALRLGRSEGTIKKHVSNILGKLGASNRTEAAILAERHNLISRKED
ncbi:MAG TPA: response regulator transcription factor [Anaerolineales bacterium]